MGWFGLEGDTDTFCWCYDISEGVNIIGCLEIVFTCLVLVFSLYCDHIIFFLPLIITLLVYCYFFEKSRLDPRYSDT